MLTTTLLPSGTRASVEPDPLVEGAATLSLNGLVQSHVNVAAPSELFYDYVRRMGNIIDTVAPAGQPITTVHLGAGALTLARYVAVTRPGSRQLVVEREAGLVPFVLSALPLPGGARLSLHEGDALDVVGVLSSSPTNSTRANDSARWVGVTDVVINDVYSGSATPPHLTTPAFYSGLRSLLSARGVLLVNVADDSDLRQTRAQSAALAQAFPVVAALGPAALLARKEPGNAVLLASADGTLLDRMPSLAAAGPHPAAWLSVQR